MTIGLEASLTKTSVVKSMLKRLTPKKNTPLGCYTQHPVWLAVKCLKVSVRLL